MREKASEALLFEIKEALQKFDGEHSDKDVIEACTQLVRSQSVLGLLCWGYCVGVIVLGLMCWGYCAGVIVLGLLCWGSYVGVIVLELLCWGYCVGVAVLLHPLW